MRVMTGPFALSISRKPLLFTKKYFHGNYINLASQGQISTFRPILSNPSSFFLTNIHTTPNYYTCRTSDQFPKPKGLSSQRNFSSGTEPSLIKSSFRNYEESRKMFSGPPGALEEASSEPFHNLQFFATCAPGLEDLVARELSSPLIGATRVETGSSGVTFCGSMLTGYRANLWLHCAVRVLLRLAQGDLNPRVPAGDSVYSFLRRSVNWADFVDPLGDEVHRRESKQKQRSLHAVIGRKAKEGLETNEDKDEGTYHLSSGIRRARIRRARTFSVESRVWDCESVSSSHLVTTRAKDAICDSLRDSYDGVKPNPPAPGECADLPLFLSLFRDHAVLYRDMSGASLHKRGYRDVMHRASLSEGIAAAMLMRANWPERVECLWQKSRGKGTVNLKVESEEASEAIILDPMCGSGTLLIEAALMAMNCAPGLLRRQWPFQFWPDYSAKLWQRSVDEAKAVVQPMPEGVRIFGNDIHSGALSLCERDAKTAGVFRFLELSYGDCKEYRPPFTPNLVVVNPPWGTRLSQTSDEEAHWLDDTWQNLGLFLKAECSRTDVFVLSGNSTVTQKLHMRASQKWPVVVGGIKCRMLHYRVLPPKPRQDGL